MQWTHIVDLLQIDVREDQFVVTRVDDSRAVGAREYVGRRQRPERLEYGRLRAQGHLLALPETA